MHKDPLAGSSWSAPGTVAGFAQSSANPVLLRYAVGERRGGRRQRLLDIGCGAARNAVPLAQLGWEVIGLDLSWPMLLAASERAAGVGVAARFALAPMDVLPIADRSVELIVAHGIWNLAESGAEFRRAVTEAARVALPGAALFVFTFSRNTLPAGVLPVPGEEFVYTEFSGEPQCFLTEAQLVAELGRAGFAPDPAVPLTEYNKARAGALAPGPPVIYECGFRYMAPFGI